MKLPSPMPETPAMGTDRADAAVPSRFRAALSWGALIAVGLLVVVLVVVAVAPRLLGIHFVIVAGGSMEPTIPFGSLTVMRDTDPSRIEVGDIVTYPSPSNPDVAVTHRVVAISDDGQLTTQGDANARADSWLVPIDEAQREYLFAIPKAGSFVQWIGTPRGYIVLVLIPALLIVGGEVRSIIRTLGSRPAGEA